MSELQPGQVALRGAGGQEPPYSCGLGWAKMGPKKGKNMKTMGLSFRFMSVPFQTAPATLPWGDLWVTGLGIFSIVIEFQGSFLIDC